MKKITVQNNPGNRLDKWLTETQPEISRSNWQRHIKTGEVKVNGKKVTPHHKVQENDIVEIKFKKKVHTEIKAEEIPLNILFEDKNYAIINKPTGLVVHPGAGHRTRTLVHAMLHYFKKLSTISGDDRPGIIHRLDKDTSGILVIAKTDEAHRNIAKQFEDRSVEKTYIALAHGHLNPKHGTIEAPLNRSEKNRQKISVTSRPGSRHAITHYDVEAYFNAPLPSSLLKIRIETGRTHQIRVHLQAIDHPVLGDPKYGNRKANQEIKEQGLTHQFLHAAELSFRSPTTNKKVSYVAPLPDELDQILKKMS